MSHVILHSLKPACVKLQEKTRTFRFVTVKPLKQMRLELVFFIYNQWHLTQILNLILVDMYALFCTLRYLLIISIFSFSILFYFEGHGAQLPVQPLVSAVSFTQL